jgi:hypothetical protein
METIEVVKQNKPIMIFRFDRTPSGMFLHAQSPVFEDMFIKMSGGKIEKGAPWSAQDSGVRLFPYILTTRIDGLPPDCRIDRWGDDSLVSFGYPTVYNMSWIKAKGLSEGINMKLENILGRDTVAKYCSMVRVLTKEIYNNIIKEFHYSLEITEKQ